MSSAHRLWAVTSGWTGPFQHEVVLVAAPDALAAAERAEGAFGEVAQPVCRAKMRIRELGRLDEGLVVGPLRADQSVADAGLDLARRCADPTDPDAIWPEGQRSSAAGEPA